MHILQTCCDDLVLCLYLIPISSFHSQSQGTRTRVEPSIIQKFWMNKSLLLDQPMSLNQILLLFKINEIDTITTPSLIDSRSLELNMQQVAWAMSNEITNELILLNNK